MSQAEPCGEFDMMIVGIEASGGMKKLRGGEPEKENIIETNCMKCLYP